MSVLGSESDFDLSRFKEASILGIIRGASPGSVQGILDACISGGLKFVELTLNSERALPSIELASKEFSGGLCIGAGTVLSLSDTIQAVNAGAQFIVTPGFNPRTVTWCQQNNVPVFPGVATPTDLEMALEHNIEVVKFFPAETLGGVTALKAFSGPYGNVRFIPTGGISASNLSDYLALPSVLACGGSWMVKADDWDQTTRLTAEALAMVNKF